MENDNDNGLSEGFIGGMALLATLFFLFMAVMAIWDPVMALLTKAEFSVLFDIHYDKVDLEKRPDIVIVRSLENKGLVITSYEEGKVFEYVETTYCKDLFESGEYDDWETELRFNRLHEGKG